MLEGRVIRIIDRQTVIINLGEVNGVDRRMRFGIYTPPEDVVDPVTGESLGILQQRKATVEALSVHEHFTVARTPIRRRPVGPSATESAFRRSLGLAGGASGVPFENVREDLPVNESEIEPLTTGNEVHVGDVVQEIVSAASRTPSQRPPSTSEGQPDKPAT
jgi:hypothetical protein